MARVSKPAVEAGTPVKANTAAKHPQQSSSASRSPAAAKPKVAAPKAAAVTPAASPGTGAVKGTVKAPARAADVAVDAAEAASRKAAPKASRPAGGRKPSAGEGAKVPGDRFLAEQQALLLEERSSHLRQAESLKDEADALAAEMEPGESEFGEEGGEGGNLSIERELDLVLSAQAKFAVDEIERALVKIENGNYGLCEKCGKEIPRARLKVLPHAPLCVACKSGGLSRR
jgi:DnaK suppressor protein